MKRSKNQNRLSFTKETLRMLDAEDLSAAVGGNEPAVKGTTISTISVYIKTKPICSRCADHCLTVVFNG